MSMICVRVMGVRVRVQIIISLTPIGLVWMFVNSRHRGMGAVSSNLELLCPRDLKFPLNWSRCHYSLSLSLCLFFCLFVHNLLLLLLFAVFLLPRHLPGRIGMEL